MRQFERMIEGVGFYLDPARSDLSTLPNHDECVQMVREVAYNKWEQSGRQPGHDWDYWLQAERELFGGREGDGYAVYVCDLSRPENRRHFRYWDQKKITPSGVFSV